MAMNHDFKASYNSNSCYESNNLTTDDTWNDTSELETIDELPRHQGFGSNDVTRRVSFPKSDSDLVTGYLEPANPWESASEVKTIDELKALYEQSCKKHNTEPITSVLEHLQKLELNKNERQTCLNLKSVALTPESCEALEEIFKRVQYEFIDISECGLNDVAGSALFDMIEYYEATNELDISDNPGISTRGWQSCISMIKRSRALQILTARGIVLSELNAANLGKSLNQSCLHTIKLEHCGLTGRPLASLCNSLRKNTILRELWIAHNDLSDMDAEKIAELLKANAYLEFLDISNNNIKDVGVKRIVIALIEQSTYLQTPKDENLALNVHNNNVLKSCEINSTVLYEESHKTSSNTLNNQHNSFINNDKQTTLSPLSSSIKNSNNIGRSMLDTLLNMNTTETKKNVEENLELIATTIEENKTIDNNENKTKNDENLTSNLINSRLDCLINNEDSNSEMCGGELQDDNSTTSGSLTPTPPFNVDSSFSDEKCYNETNFLLQNDKRSDVDEHFKTTNNNNSSSFNENQETELISTIQPPPAPSLHQITNNQLNAVNENSRTMEEFDSNSSDSAFESASEGDIKLLVEDFSKMNYPSSSVHSHLPNQNNESNVERNQQMNEQQQQQQQSQSIESKSFDTKESPISSCNILINNESGTISSEMRNRSLSSDSLSSDNSIDSASDSSQISTKINEKLTKNDTLTRQKHNNDELQLNNKKPRGLQALILWNNDITRESGEYISDLLDSTTSLELLNIGKNILSNDFLRRIKNSLQRNQTISNLGLQSTHLNSDGIKILAEILQFGGNNNLQRVDIRDNNIQVEGLAALADALKSNNSVTRIDIDDVPKRIPEDGNDTQFHYSRMLHTVRSLCSKNEKTQETPSTTATAATASNVKLSRHYMNSRKISLTCQSLRSPLPDVVVKNELGLSDTIRKRSGTRLRSPLPSPPTISPSSSPVPSPSRNRFQVFRVIEKSPTHNKNDSTTIKESPSPPAKVIPTTRFSRFKVTMVECPPLKQNEKESSTEQKRDNDTSHTEQKHKEDLIEKQLTETNTEIVLDDINSKKIEDLQASINLSKKVPPSIPEMCNVEIQTTEEMQIDDNKSVNDGENSLIMAMGESSTDSSNSDREINEEIIDDQKPSDEPEIIRSVGELVSFFQVKEEMKQKENMEDVLKSNNQLSVEQTEQNKKAGEVENEMSLVQSPLKETSNIPSEAITKSAETTSEGRSRRVSWISSGNYPATVDKLLNLFQNPGNLFSRSVSPENDKKLEDSEISSQSLIPLRKQSPPSLFQWHKTQTGEIKRISSDNMISANLQSYVRGIADFGKQVFKQNVPFMDAINVDAQQQQQDCKSIPTDIKMEIKENISPEHTVTTNSIVSFQSVSPAQEMIDMSASSRDTIETHESKDDDIKKNETVFPAAETMMELQQQQQFQQQKTKLGDVNDNK